MIGIMVYLIILLAGPLAGIFGPIAVFFTAFVLVGLREAAINVSVSPLLLNIAPTQHRPLYVGFTNTVIGAAILISGITGVIVDLFGYQALFAVGLASYPLALCGVSRIHEPGAIGRRAAAKA